MDELQELQAWYASQCDEDWEHTYGVTIETLDNPGWMLKVDLRDTELEGRSFEPMGRGDSEDDADWIHCKVEKEQFIGCGGAGNLSELLRVFLKWAGV
jgi:hypothetical protein